MNQHDGFKVMARDQRSVRDRFNKLLTDFKAKLRKEEEDSRANPEPLSEAETILEEIAEHIVSAKDDSAPAITKDNEQPKNERKKAKRMLLILMKKRVLVRNQEEGKEAW